jgi:predicted transcriptional regulator
MRKSLNIVRNKKLEHNFEPSIKTLTGVLKIMMSNIPKHKTVLSIDADLDYTRLAKHIVWLEKRSLVTSEIKKPDIHINLTEKGKVFASIFVDDLDHVPIKNRSNYVP